MQRNCIFPGRYAPLTYYDWLRGRPRNTLMARNARVSGVSSDKWTSMKER